MGKRAQTWPGPGPPGRPSRPAHRAPRPSPQPGRAQHCACAKPRPPRLRTAPPGAPALPTGTTGPAPPLYGRGGAGEAVTTQARSPQRMCRLGRSGGGVGGRKRGCRSSLVFNHREAALLWERAAGRPGPGCCSRRGSAAVPGSVGSSRSRRG